MKLVTFRDHTRKSFGVVETDQVWDVGAQCPDIPDLRALLVAALGDPARFVGSLPRAAARFLPLAALELLAPILRPSKFLGIGGNYRSHRAESAAAALANGIGQIWFNKQVSCVNAPYGDVWMPTVSTLLDYEGELGVVIGRTCRGVKAADAFSYVAGYLVCNDISVRDWQARSPTHTLGKSFDTHGPIGPWIVTTEEIGDTPDLALHTLVNGVVRQQARTSEMVASIGEMIEELSTACTLEPGDVLATGTPAGVGKSMTPPSYLRVGDVVRVEIERLGYLENRIVAHP